MLASSVSRPVRPASHVGEQRRVAGERAAAGGDPCRRRARPRPRAARSTPTADRAVLGARHPEQRRSGGQHVAQAGRHRFSRARASEACRGRARRAAMSTIVRRRAPASIGTRCGTPAPRHPAASAEAIPVGESSIATRPAGLDVEPPAGRQVGSGCGLPSRTWSPVTTAANVSGRQLSSTSVGHEPTRTTWSPARTAPRPLGSAPSSSRAPGRHGIRSRLAAHRQSSSSRSTIAGGRGRRCRLADVPRRGDQRRSRPARALLVAPRAAELRDQLCTPPRPVRLAVDEGAVEVEQDRLQAHDTATRRRGGSPGAAPSQRSASRHVQPLRSA